VRGDPSVDLPQTGNARFSSGQA